MEPKAALRWIHATAVVVDARAILILGPSGCGKSRLAFALMNSPASGGKILLLGDDRIGLEAERAGLVARPHPRIAGFIECRGLGIVAVAFCDGAPLGGCVLLGEAPLPGPIRGVPVLDLALEPPVDRVAAVLEWLRTSRRGAEATPPPIWSARPIETEFDYNL